ncbi:hypothetical protein A3A46_01065 [Candidatus Roizmanbacteria bacterium RIFCSPLOWO2_01_FULL_37_13]|uniref:HAD family hydrolase n=1 Tax=Candidatus Roizmanbacteria bacterium RIFCSPHIGHO2_02_FULL_38_11 TaxID=1802039 RepID=A0A1F7GZD9_9BACT|nr:MAG: hypothetical protein A3C25_05525 [Candidatus Roizmanbacteria bacterium RIFCSPHIGHO2_02_FULL_38_11]OGK41278.1 MAG: hypothetical protein A3A46_01065 [Candidatus Roizmanbacteria bacterium RIFCSPLOWO2_01_FULL_37_13]
MITTFLFDLGGVLYTNGSKKFISDISKKYHLSEILVEDIIDGKIGSHYREAKITRDEFWQQVIEKLNLSEDVDTLEKQWVDEYELIEETKSILLQLAKKYQLYYLSDNVKERVEVLDKKFHFTKLFKGGIFSHEVGVRKPNPKIYELALHKSKSRPDKTIFIDDKAQMLLPAKKLGIHTLLFSTPENLKSDLKRMKII